MNGEQVPVRRLIVLEFDKVASYSRMKKEFQLLNRMNLAEN